MTDYGPKSYLPS